MRVAVIAMLLVTILLVAGAGFRLATARATTPALFGINVAPKDPAPHGHTHGAAKKAAPAAAVAEEAPDADAPPETTEAAAAAPASGDEKQAALVGHLKGNSWEKTESGPAPSEKEQFENAEKVTEGREGDLKDAKARIGQIGK